MFGRWAAVRKNGYRSRSWPLRVPASCSALASLAHFVSRRLLACAGARGVNQETLPSQKKLSRGLGSSSHSDRQWELNGWSRLEVVCGQAMKARRENDLPDVIPFGPRATARPCQQTHCSKQKSPEAAQGLRAQGKGKARTCFTPRRASSRRTESARQRQSLRRWR